MSFPALHPAESRSPTKPPHCTLPFNSDLQIQTLIFDAMAGGKKKKKPASNPARGFATTSVASKPKAEALDIEPSSPIEEIPGSTQDQEPTISTTDFKLPGSASPAKHLTPGEFEKQLENSELQILVDKHAQKSKRDALRQKTRLETDRRVLRGQAEILNTRKWLPPELMEEILELVKAEGRFSGQAAESSNALRQSSEEELTIRLWTLHQSLIGAGFLEEKTVSALRHVLDISDKIGSGNKDSIWGLDEALDWLARECSRDELPDYESWQRKQTSITKSQTGKLVFLAKVTFACTEWSVHRIYKESHNST